MNTFLKTPPMGWNSWDCYGASVNEKEIRQNADFIAKYLKPYGYEYVTVDIQWAEPLAGGTNYRNLAKLCMDEYGRLIPPENRFPSAAGGKGFAPLAEYVHSLGLKFGIHILRGIPREACYRDLPVKGTNVTTRDVGLAGSVCLWNFDMYGVKNTPEGQAYYNSIFELYASWGVDFVKVDDLSRPYFDHIDEIHMIRKAIDHCGRDMVFSASPGATTLEAAADCIENLNMWRISDDFWDDWELLYPQFERLHNWNQHVVEGHYPDADMIPIGMLSVRSNNEYNKPRHSNFTWAENETMMALWCFARSPLILGCETTLMSKEELALFTNRELLSLDQQGEAFCQAYREGDTVIWQSKADGKQYLGIFNTADREREVAVDLTAYPHQDTVRDVLNPANYAVEGETLTLTVDAHGCKVVCL